MRQFRVTRQRVPWLMRGWSRAQGVLLNMALINYAMSFLVRRGYTPVQTPFFMRKVRVVRTLRAR